jgi:hypothetical protein
MYRLFQMKKLPTTKLYNFSRSTTFVLVVSPSEVIQKIQISSVRNSNIIFPCIDYFKSKGCQL